MNPGKRLIRNTVFVVWGTFAAFVALNRIYAATDADTTPWVRTALSLGLRPVERGERPADVDLATVKDFTHVSVRGRLNVEIVGGDAYKVSLVPEAGQEPKFHAWREEDMLRVWEEGDDEGAAVATLHIEVPTLVRISAHVNQLSVRGLKAEEVALVGYGAMSAKLQQNEVRHWRMFASEPMDVQMDDATFAAGTLKSGGDVVIRRAE
jgi:hypothetical protein